MQIHELIQGSPEWLAYRSEHFNASDAPAMLGCSPYKTRDQLLRELHTGIAEAVDAGQQKRFDNGHRLEALARPLAEQIIGEELYPVTGSKGRLSASFDGLTLDERQGFEHKALNAELRAAFRAIADGAGTEALPLHYRVQMEQQLQVSGGERVLFVASEFDADDQLVEMHHVWYEPDAELRAQILRGWDQFAADLAAYKLPEAKPAEPVGRTPETLPALRIEISGQVTESNLPEFKQTALAAIRAVNRDLQTDQDFADAKLAVKWFADVEDRIAAAKRHALSQTASIDELMRTLDEISGEARRGRLDLDKLVTRREQEIKESEVAKARAALAEHVAALNAEIAPATLRPLAVDFAAAIKGLKSFDSMRSKLGAALASGKIEASAQAQAIRANLASYKATAAECFGFLFPDLGQLVHKPADDFRAAVELRVTQHQQAEAERKRREAEAQAERERQEAAARAAAEAQQQAAAVSPVAAPVAQIGPSVSSGHAVVSAIAAGVSPSGPTVPLRADEPATLKLGAICERLGFTMTAAFVAETLGVAPKTEGASKLFTEQQFHTICERLVSLVREVQAEHWLLRDKAGREQVAA